VSFNDFVHKIQVGEGKLKIELEVELLSKETVRTLSILQELLIAEL